MKTELEKADWQLKLADAICIITFAILVVVVGTDFFGFIHVSIANFISLCLFPTGILIALKQMSHGRLSAAKKGTISPAEYCKISHAAKRSIKFAIVCGALSVLTFWLVHHVTGGNDIHCVIAILFCGICLIPSEPAWFAFWLKRTGKVQPEGTTAIVR